MAIQDLIPVMEDKDLVTLRGNARRLETSGSAKQQAAATELLPLIDAEIATRKARAPAKAAILSDVSRRFPVMALPTATPVSWFRSSHDHRYQGGANFETKTTLDSIIC